MPPVLAVRQLRRGRTRRSCRSGRSLAGCASRLAGSAWHHGRERPDRTMMPRNPVCPRPGCGKRHTSPRQTAACAAAMNASGGSTGAPVSRYTKPVNETPWKRGQDPAGYRGDAPQSRPAPTFGNIRNAHELCAVMSEIEPPDGYGRKWHDLETPDRDLRVYREDPDDIVVASASGKIPDPVGSVAYKIRTLGGGTDVCRSWRTARRS